MEPVDEAIDQDCVIFQYDTHWTGRHIVIAASWSQGRATSKATDQEKTSQALPVLQYYRSALDEKTLSPINETGAKNGLASLT
jgi:hypothetical protein